ncbi:SMC-Scp complex subunit ScpB [Parendozoicomonas haliclonae]|uniref:Segregation and condensation protein B n=1 Tax=Parendozoicomonas haliclonae TaxID=1960125 RepID=A0A1X7ASY6_9GAMM|nr:hypothetical protein EHSB41UT_04328 [Parendozoicomonas haliclonae]
MNEELEQVDDLAEKTAAELNATGEDVVDEAVEEAVEEGVAIFGEAPVVPVVEAALMASGKPMTLEQLAALFDEDYRPDKPTLKQAMVDIAASCEGRGFELKEVASGWRFQVRQELAPWVGRLWDEKPQRYTRALLETLALIAYRQPITRGEIEDIRGVSVSTNIIRTLQEREWVRVVGHRDVPGRPAMYATTRQFLDYFNLQNLDELPPLSELRDLDAMAKQLEGGAAEGDQPELPLVELDENGEPIVSETAEAAEGGVDASELVSHEQAQAFHEEGNENIDKLFAELDDMEGSLTLTYKDYNPLEDPKPEFEPSNKKTAEKAKTTQQSAEAVADETVEANATETEGDIESEADAISDDVSDELTDELIVDLDDDDQELSAEQDDVSVEDALDSVFADEPPAAETEATEEDEEDDEDFELYRPTIVIDDDDEDEQNDDLSSFMDDFENRRPGDEE